MKKVREIRVQDLITYFYLPLIFIISIWLVFSLTTIKFNARLGAFIYLILAVCLIINYFLLKRLAIGTVLMYKAYAPLETRDKCRFEPTCSTYMIMAIQKYGLILGVAKGIKRITRCKPPNGGVDFP